MSLANHANRPLRALSCYDETRAANIPRKSGLNDGVRSTTVLGVDVNTNVEHGLRDSLRLRPMERRLLSQLRVNTNEVVLTRDLIAMLYDNIDVASGRTRLKRLVADVRSRLGPSLARRLQTVHGIGLMWVDE